MSLPSKVASASNPCLKDKNESSSFCSLAQNLVSKLPPSPNAFTESKIPSYYDNIKFKDLNL